MQLTGREGNVLTRHCQKTRIEDVTAKLWSESKGFMLQIPKETFEHALQNRKKRRRWKATVGPVLAPTRFKKFKREIRSRFYILLSFTFVSDTCHTVQVRDSKRLKALPAFSFHFCISLYYLEKAIARSAARAYPRTWWIQSFARGQPESS